MSLLDVQPADRVLEIGSGPGLAIQELSHIAREGYVCGIDHSEVMVRQARKRNADGIRRGVVDLRLASVDALPAFDAPRPGGLIAVRTNRAGPARATPRPRRRVVRWRTHLPKRDSRRSGLKRCA